MRAILLLAVCLIALFVFSVPVHWWLLQAYAPRRYAALKSQGRFHSMPGTWDELWHMWTHSESEFEKEIRRLAGMSDPPTFYGQFVDRYLMPVPYLRLIATWAGIAGVVLLAIWAAAKLLARV